jgi:hypothetical protein
MFSVRGAKAGAGAACVGAAKALAETGISRVVSQPVSATLTIAVAANIESLNDLKYNICPFPSWARHSTCRVTFPMT